MKHLVEFSLEDGSTITAEVDEARIQEGCDSRGAPFAGH